MTNNQMVLKLELDRDQAAAVKLALENELDRMEDLYSGVLRLINTTKFEETVK